MKHKLTLLLFAFLFFLLPGCQNPGAREEGPSSGPEKQTLAEKISIDLKERSSDWTGSGKSGFGNRYAILVGVDQYIVKGWDLPFIAKNITELEKALVEDLKFSKENILTITGKEAARDTILSALENRFYEKLKGKDNLILFYYSGHGFLNASDQRQHFLTYNSSVSGNNLFIGTLSDAEIRKGFIRLKKKLPSGVGIRTLFLFDACQSQATAKMAPVSFTPKEIQVAEVVMTSTKPGQYGGTNDSGDMSLFTDALCKALRRGAKGDRVDIEGLFGFINSAMERKGHQPQLLGKDRDLLLFTRKAIPVRFEVYSALETSKELAATLKVNNRTYSAPASLPSLEQGEYFLTVSAPGYYPRMEKVTITPAENGKTCRIYLIAGMLPW